MLEVANLIRVSDQSTLSVAVFVARDLLPHHHSGRRIDGDDHVVFSVFERFSFVVDEVAAAACFFVVDVVGTTEKSPCQRIEIAGVEILNIGESLDGVGAVRVVDEVNSARCDGVPPE